MAAAVEVSNLVRRYSPVAGITDVTFSAPEAAVTALLGRNGAGKTTTVEICCGLRRADSGTVRVLGLDPATDVAELRARVGVMPQAGGSGASGVYPAVRVEEALRLYSAMYADPLPVDALLEVLDLQRVRRTTWRRLSGGEQQRVSLALALVGRPAVVFLDEPSAGLDVHARHTTWDLVRELRKAGVSIILTTHDLAEASVLADHVVIIDGGRVVATGSPADLTRDASTDGLRFEAPAGLALDSLDTALPDGATAHEVRPGHYAVGPRVDPDVVAAVTAWCAQQGVMADNLTTSGQTLEDVFLSLTAPEAP
ncbi:MAG TPA: ABC transporter ATP-binding protein [Mycobacteriales bacterium]|nr:ABC transporter ATP-binding protein [Mycobacteriales bacterium]